MEGMTVVQGKRVSIRAGEVGRDREPQGPVRQRNA